MGGAPLVYQRPTDRLPQPEGGIDTHIAVMIHKGSSRMRIDAALQSKATQGNDHGYPSHWEKSNAKQSEPS